MGGIFLFIFGVGDNEGECFFLALLTHYVPINVVLSFKTIGAPIK
jgi:hypothetical protein